MTTYVMHREVCLKHRKNRREIILRVRTQVPSWQRCLFFFVAIRRASRNSACSWPAVTATNQSCLSSTKRVEWPRACRGVCRSFISSGFVPARFMSDARRMPRHASQNTLQELRVALPSSIRRSPWFLSRYIPISDLPGAGRLRSKSGRAPRKRR